ncbi:pleckstrin homology domain-containing family S member 1 isoform X2 [Notamacropus eugenii]|uniref:pleckstrin homology domain-containing family S member 1 isoform X2 n=1 Tax=Notamacropus eugenii TaxID=9315 RepID=UPI003B672B2B
MTSKPEAHLVYRQAHFIKSPPPHLFNSQTSWKSRYFTLSKNEENCYSLQYFKDHHYRGSIEVDQISSIEVGIRNDEKRALVEKMFKCPPEKVMSIMTPKREYFLIGKDWRTIDDWVSFISLLRSGNHIEVCSAWDGKIPMHRVLPNEFDSRLPPDKNLNLVNQDARNEANVVQPLDSKGNRNIYEIIPGICNNIQKIDFSEDKRPVSYPGHSSGSPRSPEDKTCPSHSRNSFPDMKTYAIARSRAVKIKAPKNQGMDDFLSRSSQSPPMSDLAPENQQVTEEESYYLTPRSVLAQLDSIILSNEDKEFAESKEPDEVSESNDHLYMKMKSCFVEEKFQQPSNIRDEAQNFPGSQAEGLNLQGQETRSELCHSSSIEEPKTTNQQKESVSLSVVQLSKIIDNVPAGSPLEEVDVFLSKNDFIYLTLTQASGHICVAQWEGPPHLGCIFHHGDRIAAVNDLKARTLEEVGLFLDRALRKEVKLTICRIPDSDKFHTVTCTCS